MWARTLLLAAFIAIGSAATPGVDVSRAQTVQPGWMIPTQDRGQRREDILSLREVVDMVRNRYGGELISARLEDGGRPFYVLRWRLANSEVRDIRVDAVSGQFR